MDDARGPDTPARLAEPLLPAAVQRVLAGLAQGAISGAAYDTAFALRVRDRKDPETLAYPRSLDWLLRSQAPDGSFGTPLPIPKEKLITTLSALLALVDLPPADQSPAVHRARLATLRYLWEGTAGWQSGPFTAGFELLLPALLEQARSRELPLPHDRFAGISAQRDAKIGQIPPSLVYRVATPLLHSLEYLGDRLDVEAARPQLAANGSFANSPSATAFYLTRTEEPRARAYLSGLLARRPDGGIPVVEPFDVFERAWVLYNLACAGYKPKAAQPHLTYLAQALTEDGVGVSKEGLRPDADDTALTLCVLHRYGYPISMGPLRAFEGVSSFLTFPLERDPSVTANAHALEVVSACPRFARQHAVQEKVIRFLRDARADGSHWLDKWHVSPLYATAHAVFALTALAPDLCRPALSWLRETQRPDGSWGWFGSGTPEETAYAVQAWLTTPAELRGSPPVDLDGAERYLRETEDSPVIPMWVGKTLYAPLEVVRSAVLSARILLQRRMPC